MKILYIIRWFDQNNKYCYKETYDYSYACEFAESISKRYERAEVLSDNDGAGIDVYEYGQYVEVRG